MIMTQVQLISTNLIKPASHIDSTPITRFELTAFDLNFLLMDYFNKGILFKKPTLHQQKHFNNNVIDHLKLSFSRTLDYFPPLAGRLATVQHDDDTTSFFLSVNGAGALFAHAVAAGVTVASIVDAVTVPSVVLSFFQLKGIWNVEGVSNPLLAIQVTELDDGIFIGLTANHSIIDGTSFWHFINSWSEIARGTNQISQFPVFNHGLFDFPARIPSSQLKSLSKSDPPLLQQKIFHYTKEKILELKSKANIEMGTTRISSLQAILGHLMRSIVRCRNSPTGEEINLKILVGMRNRLNPPLPEKFFGNVVLFESASAIAGEIMDNGDGWTAWQLNKMIGLQTYENVKVKLGNWVKNPKLPKYVGELNTSLAAGNSPRFDWYGNDFGWGQPVAVRSGDGNIYDGKISVFSGREEGSVDLEAFLGVETVEGLVVDEEFMKVVAG